MLLRVIIIIMKSGKKCFYLCINTEFFLLFSLSSCYYDDDRRCDCVCLRFVYIHFLFLATQFNLNFRYILFIIFFFKFYKRFRALFPLYLCVHVGRYVCVYALCYALVNRST